MGAIKGLHHVALKVVPEKYEAVIDFYQNFLELPLIRRAPGCAMLDLGNTILEIIHQDDITYDRSGCLDHIALCVAKDDVDAMIEKVRAAGFEVTMEPNDLDFGCEPKYAARIAFFTGVYGESVEFFAEI